MNKNSCGVSDVVVKMLKISILKWSYGLSGNDYRVATLS